MTFGGNSVAMVTDVNADEDGMTNKLVVLYNQFSQVICSVLSVYPSSVLPLPKIRAQSGDL